MKQRILAAVKFLIYLTFFVPLLVLPTSFIFPFIVPKILAFRSLVELMIGGYVLLLFINWHEFRPRFSWLSTAVGAFFISFAISTFVGVDPYHSFWDNHERMLGLFTIFHYVAYYFICSSLFKTWDDWQKALKIFLKTFSFWSFLGDCFTCPFIYRDRQRCLRSIGYSFRGLLKWWYVRPYSWTEFDSHESRITTSSATFSSGS